MLGTRPVTAFVATTMPARAEAFYAKTLGLKLVSDDGFALVFHAGGTMLRVARVQQLQPAPYTVLGWIVPDIRRAVRDLSRRGVSFERYPGLDQDESGLWTAPGGARVAWFKDPDGNTMSLTEVERQSAARRPPGPQLRAKAAPRGNARSVRQ